MNSIPGVSKQEKAFILSVLKKHLPLDTEVYFFGSRVDGTHKTSSDLDISIKGCGPIDLGILALIREAFETSDLPYKVDILDDQMLSPAMRENALRTAVRVTS